MDGRMLQRRRLQAESGQQHAHAGMVSQVARRGGLRGRSLKAGKADVRMKRKRHAVASQRD